MSNLFKFKNWSIELVEDIADDRTFDTWWETVKPRLETTHIKIDHLITDRAKALIKLATAGANCESGSDLFHPLQTLSRRLGNPLKRRYTSLSNTLKKSWKEKDILSLQQALSETTATELEKEKESSLNEKINEINELNKEKRMKNMI